MLRMSFQREYGTLPAYRLFDNLVASPRELFVDRWWIGDNATGFGVRLVVEYLQSLGA